MERGEVYWADLEPSLGSEANKRRPCLLVSNNASNRASSTITVLPISGQTDSLYPFEVLLETELDRPCKVQANQIRTISKRRISGSRITRLSDGVMSAVDDAIRLHLSV